MFLKLGYFNPKVYTKQGLFPTLRTLLSLEASSDSQEVIEWKSFLGGLDILYQINLEVQRMVRESKVWQLFKYLQTTRWVANHSDYPWLTMLRTPSWEFDGAVQAMVSQPLMQMLVADECVDQILLSWSVLWRKVLVCLSTLRATYEHRCGLSLSLNR